MKKSLTILNNSLTTVIVQVGVGVGEYISLPSNSWSSSNSAVRRVNVRRRATLLQQKLLSSAIGVYLEHAELKSA